MNQSIYEALGGRPAIDAAVDSFYDKVWADPELVGYFEAVRRPKLKAHMRAFMALAFGGPDVYRGRPLGQAHRGLGITDEAFDRVVAHLGDTLTELNVPAETIDAIVEKLGPLRSDVVEHSSETVAVG